MGDASDALRNIQAQVQQLLLETFSRSWLPLVLVFLEFFLPQLRSLAVRYDRRATGRASCGKPCELVVTPWRAGPCGMHGVCLSPTKTAHILPQLNAFRPVSTEAANLPPAPPVTLSTGCIVVVHLVVDGKDRNLLLLVDRAFHPPKPRAAKAAARKARAAIIPQGHVDDVSYKYDLYSLQGFLLPHTLSALVTSGPIHPPDWALLRTWDPFALNGHSILVTGATLYGRTLPGREWQALLQPPPNCIAPLFGISPPPALEGDYVISPRRGS